MGRPEKPLDPGLGAVEQFAAELRAARIRAGEPTYRQLARATHFSAATLARAAAGRALPSLDVTLAYVSACGVEGPELAHWRRRWEEARRASGGRAAPKELGPEHEPEQEQAPEQEQDLVPDPPPAPTREARPARTLVRSVLAASLATNVGLLYLFTASAPAIPTPAQTPSLSPARSAAVPDATDPKAYHCADDAINLDQVPLLLPQDATINGRVQPAGTALGTVSLRFSARCAGAWARYDPAEDIFGEPSQGTVTATTLRTSDATSSTFHLGHIDQAYSDLMLTGLGCIEAHASVVVANGGVTASGSTKCLPKS